MKKLLCNTCGETFHFPISVRVEKPGVMSYIDLCPHCNSDDLKLLK